MPTYDYQCPDCNYSFELFQSITAKPEKKCPECGKNNVKRLIGIGAGVIFKGGGFYETDYRSESYKKDADADKAASKPVVETAKAVPDASEAKPKPEKKAKKEAK
ncbi:MAG: zinc ribbon domain-containing protein [Phycisphaerae bacterium]|nr:zinc ribbon domain-containing protein [Phycisphaerae bacterium]